MEAKDIKSGKDYIKYILEYWDELEIPVDIVDPKTKKKTQTVKTFQEIDFEQGAPNCIATVSQILMLSATRGFMPKKRSEIVEAKEMPPEPKNSSNDNVVDGPGSKSNIIIP